jgi:hypothetical protein
MTQPAHQPADYQYRITKYDPANRDPAGHYFAEDWHLYAQIGEAFGGVVLTEEEYLRVEAAYIATAQRFHLESGLPAIRAVSVEGHRDRGAPREAEVILPERLPAICRAMLREEYCAESKVTASSSISDGISTCMSGRPIHARRRWNMRDSSTCSPRCSLRPTIRKRRRSDRVAATTIPQPPDDPDQPDSLSDLGSIAQWGAS